MQPVAITRLVAFVGGCAAVDESAVDLRIQLFAVDHQHEGVTGRYFAMDFLAEKNHRITLAAALRMPEHAQATGRHIGRIVLQIGDSEVHAQILVIARDDFHREAFAAVKQREILDYIQQVVLAAHAFQQDG